MSRPSTFQVLRGSRCIARKLASPMLSSKSAGVLRLYERRLGSIYRDASTWELNSPYRYGNHTWTPVPGWMALFPAHVPHEVSVVRSVHLTDPGVRDDPIHGSQRQRQPVRVGRFVELTSAFAVPIGHARLESCDRLNRELEQLFLARETQEYRNPAPSHNPQAEMFESRFDLFTWPEPCIQELRKFMLEGVFRVAMAASEMAPEEFARLRLNNHTWFHITRRTGHFVAHNHALASWSAVYCVKDGTDPAGAPCGGLLRLFDTRGGADAFRGYGQSAFATALSRGRS